ncbi:zinc transport system permease protein [Rhizomicrobium palustre]|uniref:High-affinity zinc uptake system membrane protein ZnuB n=1 Tax=Rhizomicrobium palustre TaxID=189966 RepID=A0A846MYP9_9PROT|nr:metal ABC transporter permease [Rhizomicrobium palustre]NIK88221.1 zinc transport system permease protein [Rhizomicrobium palustre]
MTTSFLFDGFLWRAALGAGLLAAASGPVGCFILWRRMAYVGESVAHMGLLGAAVGLLIGVNALWGTAALAVIAALVMSRASDRTIPAGTFVGIIGHMGLALGFIVLSLMETVRADLLGYLFGDVLALTEKDIFGIAAAGIAVLLAMAVLWKPLLRSAVGGAIAAAEGKSSPLTQTAFLILTALLVAFGLKVVGALLIVALLLIPPAAARPLARTPEAMALWATAIGAVSAPLGLAAAYAADAPAGPSIVLAAGALFALTHVAAALSRR